MQKTEARVPRLGEGTQTHGVQQSRNKVIQQTSRGSRRALKYSRARLEHVAIVKVKQRLHEEKRILPFIFLHGRPNLLT